MVGGVGRIGLMGVMDTHLDRKLVSKRRIRRDFRKQFYQRERRVLLYFLAFREESGSKWGIVD